MWPLGAPPPTSNGTAPTLPSYHPLPGAFVYLYRDGDEAKDCFLAVTHPSHSAPPSPARPAAGANSPAAAGSPADLRQRALAQLAKLKAEQSALASPLASPLASAGGADNVNTPSPDPRPRSALPIDLEASSSRFEEKRPEEKRGLFGNLFGGGKRDKDKDKPPSASAPANIAALPSPPLPPAPANLEAGDEEGGSMRRSVHATHGSI
eukprot:scaffold98864_cov59-Phaeocystis_antarctica.AAC.2